MSRTTTTRLNRALWAKNGRIKGYTAPTPRSIAINPNDTEPYSVLVSPGQVINWAKIGRRQRAKDNPKHHGWD